MSSSTSASGNGTPAGKTDLETLIRPIRVAPGQFELALEPGAVEQLSQDMPLVDNGSGLSRESRVTAQAMARMLQHAWASPVMPELMSSLPISGVDGTLVYDAADVGK